VKNDAGSVLKNPNLIFKDQQTDYMADPDER